MDGNKTDQLGSLKSATSLTTSVNSKEDLKKNVSNMTMETVIVEMPELKIIGKNDKNEHVSNDQNSQLHPYQTRTNSIDSGAPSSLGIIDNRSHSSLAKSSMASPTRQFFGTHLEDPIYEEDNEDTDDTGDADARHDVLHNGGNDYNEYNEDDTLEDPLDLDARIAQNNKYNHDNNRLIDVNPLSSFHSHPSTSTLHNKSSSLLISEDEHMKNISKTNKDGKNESSKQRKDRNHLGSKNSQNLLSGDNHSINSMSSMNSLTNYSDQFNANSNSNSNTNSSFSQIDSNNTKTLSSNLIDNTIMNLSPTKRPSLSLNHGSTRSLQNQQKSTINTHINNKKSNNPDARLKSVVSNEVVTLNPDLNLLRHVGSSATMPTLSNKFSETGETNSNTDELVQNSRAMRGLANRQDSIQSTNSLNITKNRSSTHDNPIELPMAQQNEKMAHPKPLSRMPSSISPSDALQPTNNNGDSKTTQLGNKINLENTNNGMNNKTSMHTLPKKQSSMNEKLHSRNSTSLLGRDTSMSSANLEDKSKLNAVSSSSLVIPTDKISTSIANPTKNVKTAKNLKSGSQKNDKDEAIDVNKILANRTDYFAAKLASATSEKIKSNDDNDEDFVYEKLMIGHNSHDPLAHAAMVKNALKGNAIANINEINHNLDKKSSQLNVEAAPSILTTTSTIAAPNSNSNLPAGDLNASGTSLPAVTQTHGSAQPKNHSTPGNISHQSSVIIDPTKLMVSQQSSQHSLKMKSSMSQELHHQTTMEKLTNSKGTHVPSNFPQKLHSKGISSKLSAPVLNTTGPNSAASKRLASAAAARHASIGPGPIPQRNSLVNTTGTVGVSAPNSTKQLPVVEKAALIADNQDSTSTSPKKKNGSYFKKQASRNSIAEEYQEQAQSTINSFKNQANELQPEPFGVVQSQESTMEGASSPSFLQGEFRAMNQNQTSNFQSPNPQLRTTASRMFGKHSTASSIKRHVPKDVNLEDYIDELQDSEYDLLSNSHNKDSTRFPKGQLFNETLNQFQTGSAANANFKTRNGVKNLDQKVLPQRGVASNNDNFSASVRDDAFGHPYLSDQNAEPMNSRPLDHNDDESDTKSDFFYRANQTKPKKNTKQQLKQFKRLSQSSVGSYAETDLQPPITNSVFPGRRIFTNDHFEQLGAQSCPNAIDGNKARQNVDADDMDSFYTIGDNFVNDHKYGQHRNDRYSFQDRTDAESERTHRKDMEYASQTPRSRNAGSLRDSQWEAMDQYENYASPATTPHTRSGISPSHYIGDDSDEEDDMHSTSDLNMYFDSLDDEPRAIANHGASNFSKYGSIGSNLNKNITGNGILPQDGESPPKLLLQPRFQTGNYSSAANNMFSPHNYKKRVRKSSIWYKFRNFVYFAFIITSLLVLGFICGFFLASNKDLQSFDLSKIDNILSTNDELLFDIVAVALNAGLFTISISDVELDIFAESKYTASTPDEDDDDNGESSNISSQSFTSWETANALSKSMDNHKKSLYDDADSEPWETILLGTVYNLEEPLEFRGTFFKRDFDISGSSVKLRNPGLPDSLPPPPPPPSPPKEPLSSSTFSSPPISTSSFATVTTNTSSKTNSRITSTLSPSNKTLHQISSLSYSKGKAQIRANDDSDHRLSSNPYEKYEQWKRLNKYEYNLIIRGKAYYRVPFFQNQKYIAVQQQVLVNPGKKRKP
ncbi:hypothetical protein ACO0QE_001178 [Hanseniaspora vineae]